MSSPDENARRTVLQLLASAQLAGIQQLPKKAIDLSGSFPGSRTLDHAAALPEDEGSQTLPARPSQSQVHPDAGNPHPFQMMKSPRLLFDDSEPPKGGENVSKAPNLDALRLEVAQCTLCEELARTRTQVVFGAGNPRARLCFLGEAPGADEDRAGEPFVGRAGKLLTEIIHNGMKLRRSDVYILNILKCRPPGNRNPLPQEAANCRPFLIRQLELIQPEFICCLGAVAAQNLLGTDEPIGSLRGRLYDWRAIRVVCTYHPAYLLRNPAAKAKTWDDIQLLMRAMGLMIKVNRL